MCGLVTQKKEADHMTEQSGLEDHLVTLIARRNEIFEERLRVQREGEAKIIIGGPNCGCAQDPPGSRLQDRSVVDEEFRKYMDEMRTLGAEIVALDERIEEVRVQLARINGVS